ncbi:MAG: S26 family signal peptidase [Candidatus Levybacteria bacterium]|nr:S26 family signal peptidase [Candidatus Levybacteria bacterium]
MRLPVKIFKVSGHSMMPYLSPTDSVLVFTFLKIKKGNVIVFKHHSKNMIKRVSKLEGNNVYVEGDNTNDSLDVGKISKRDIIGKVVFKI